MTFLRKSDSLVAVWIKSSAATAQCSFSFCSGSRSHGTNFTTTGFMPRSCIKISDTVVFGIPRSASSSHTVSHWSVMIVACPCQHSQVFCLLWAPQNVDHFQQILKHLWSVSATLYLYYTHCIIPKSLLNHLNIFHGGMFPLNAKSDADSLLYSLSPFEYAATQYTSHSVASATSTD